MQLPSIIMHLIVLLIWWQLTYCIQSYKQGMLTPRLKWVQEDKLRINYTTTHLASGQILNFRHH